MPFNLCLTARPVINIFRFLAPEILDHSVSVTHEVTIVKKGAASYWAFWMGGMPCFSE